MSKIIENVGNITISSLEAVSHLTLGQMLLKFLDRCMGIIEKTAEWSLPSHEMTSEENGKSFKEMKLVRPLPWILFLPSLLILRGFRFAWNVGAYVIGFPECQPNDITRCLQKSRRRLRSIRINGGKKLRKVKPPVRDKSLRITEAKRSLLKTLQLALTSLSCLDASKLKSTLSPTRIRIYANNVLSTTPDEKSATESTTHNYDSKRKYSTISSDDQSSEESDQETLNSKIERYALINSSDDDDFDPEECSSRSEATDDEGEELIEDLADEIRENKAEYLQMLKDTLHYTSESKRKGILEIPIQKDTADNENIKMVKMPSEEQAFYSPKNMEDGETAFYSPISSKSTSPEPESNGPEIVNEYQEKSQDNSQKAVVPNSSELLSENGEKEDHASKNVNSVEQENTAQPGVNIECTSDLSTGKNKQNHNQKSKRNSQGNRKKK